MAGCAGIGYSDDKLLQSRIFSYPDTQRYRLGPNYLQLPWNAPKCPHHNNHHEGLMDFMHRDEEVCSSPCAEWTDDLQAWGLGVHVLCTGWRNAVELGDLSASADRLTALLVVRGFSL